MIAYESLIVPDETKNIKHESNGTLWLLNVSKLLQIILEDSQRFLNYHAQMVQGGSVMVPDESQKIKNDLNCPLDFQILTDGTQMVQLDSKRDQDDSQMVLVDYWFQMTMLAYKIYQRLLQSCSQMTPIGLTMDSQIVSEICSILPHIKFNGPS